MPEQISRQHNHLVLAGQTIRYLKPLFGIPDNEMLLLQTPEP
ncbi:hypothetical protein EVA_21281, partial [gut metagenome]